MERNTVKSVNNRCGTRKNVSNKSRPDNWNTELEQKLTQLPFPGLPEAFCKAAKACKRRLVSVEQEVQLAKTEAAKSRRFPKKAGKILHKPISLGRALDRYLKETPRCLFLHDPDLDLFLARLALVELWKICWLYRQSKTHASRATLETAISNVCKVADYALLISHLEDAFYTPLEIIEDEPRLVEECEPQEGAIQKALLKNIGSFTRPGVDLGVISHVNVRDLQNAVTIMATQGAFKFNEQAFRILDQ